MVVEKKGDKLRCYSSLICCTKWCHLPVSSSSSSLKAENEPENKPDAVLSDSKTTQRKPAGWKSMPYVLGNETFERLASMGLLANFMVYLLTQLQMDQVAATNLINVWSGASNFAPMVGAFISDAYLGRFWTIAFSSIASFLGMVTLTLTAWIPRLHPLPCTAQPQGHNKCMGPTQPQMAALLTALGLVSIGTGGIRPCSIPFGVDQFDQTTEAGRRGVNSYFNWYYTTFTVVVMIALTLVVYIQDSVSWVLGFGLLAFLMLCSIILFFWGTRIYVYVEPEGSVFSGIVQVFVAAYKKRRLKFPAAGDVEGRLYDPPAKRSILSKLPMTKQYRFLNKGAIVVDNELSPGGSPSNPWRLCSIQQIEEVKCLIRIVPIWASGIICFTPIVQQGTFTVSQALKMDRHLGPNFQIPAGSIAIISMLTVGLWLPFYDRILVPYLRKITKHETGITLLQRIGIGMAFSFLSMFVAGLIETKRRASAIAHGKPDGVAPISVMWLAPQLILMGFAEAFNVIGQIEFFNKQFPENMRSIGNSFFFCSLAGANYFSSLVVVIVHDVTGKNGRSDWLTNDINAGRIDYYYYLLAGLGVLNFIYFLVCAQRYQYKGSMPIQEEEYHCDPEVNSIKE